jgi:hypothetical protein
MLAASLVSAGLCRAADQPSNPRFDIAAQSLSGALNEFARQSQLQILFGPGIVSEKRSPVLRGDMPARAALKLLLRGSGLTFTTTANGTILVGKGSQAPMASIQALPSEGLPHGLVSSLNDEPVAITVEGIRSKHSGLQRQVRNYLSVIASAQHGEYFARWTRDTPLCAQVTGLSPDDGQLLLGRLQQIAGERRRTHCAKILRTQLRCHRDIPAGRTA